MKRLTVVVWGAVGLVGALAGGCGKSGSNKSDGGLVGNACSDSITKYCDRLEACEPGVLPLFGFASVADCIASDLPWCNDELNAPGTGATAALVEQCGEGTAALSCADFLQGKTASACLPQGGTISNGGACLTNWQCVSGRCSMQDFGACGTCEPEVPAGQPCTQSGLLGSACADNLVCAVTTPGGTATVCTAPVAMGGACADLSVCPTNGYCDGTSHVCKQLPAIGESCDPSAIVYCDPTRAGAVCDPTSSLCVGISAVKAGQACSTVGDAINGCSGVCGPLGDSSVATCSPFVTEGQPCTSDDLCVLDATCTAGVCAALVCDGTASSGNDAAAAAVASVGSALRPRRAIGPLSERRRLLRR